MSSVSLQWPRMACVPQVLLDGVMHAKVRAKTPVICTTRQSEEGGMCPWLHAVLAC